MTPRVTRAQALTWRLGRHYLLTGAPGVREVVARLGCVAGWAGDSEWAVRRRLAADVQQSGGQLLARALDAGELMKTWTHRGNTHLMTPDEAGRALALKAAARQWESPSWRRQFGLDAAQWQQLRAVVRQAVADGPVASSVLAAAVRGHRVFGHLEESFASGDFTLLKPFAWQGDLCFGPSERGHTFMSPSAVPGWTGLADYEAAGLQAVSRYLACYGPASAQHLQYWWGEGLSVRRRDLLRWVDALLDAGEVTFIEVSSDDGPGEPMLVRCRDREAVLQTEPAPSVVLLAGLDQWVMGPGTWDDTIVPPPQRSEMSRGASPVVLDGAVAGTWQRRGEEITVRWFDPDSRPGPGDIRDRLLQQEMAHRLLGEARHGGTA